MSDFVQIAWLFYTKELLKNQNLCLFIHEYETHVLSHYIFHPTKYTLVVGSNIVNSHPTWFRKHKIVLWLGIRCVCEFFNTHCGVEKSALFPPLDKNCACDIYGIISFYWIYKSSKTTKTRSGIFFPRFSLIIVQEI